MILLDPEEIEALFDKFDNQGDVFIEIYKMVFPEWDQITKIHGWPVMGEVGQMRIMQLFREFDKKYHPTVMAGGLWFNSGFSASKSLEAWTVDRTACKIDLQEGEAKL